MRPPYKVVGRAVAIQRGHYPRPDGGSRRIEVGETFDLFEGITKGSWFKAIEPGKPAPTPPVDATPPGQPLKKAKAKAPAPTPDDLA